MAGAGANDWSRRALLWAGLGGAAATLGACASGSGPADSTSAATAGAAGSPGASAPSGGTSAAGTPGGGATGNGQQAVSGGASAPATGPWPAAATVSGRADVPVLCYHQVRDWEPGDTSYNKQLLICPPKNFAAHLDAIEAAGYTTISPYHYEQHLRTGAGLPAKPVVITLDDGKDNQMSTAFPALEKRGMTATFFVMTVILGSPGWLRKDDVRRLAAGGMTIGSHTWDHHRADRYAGTDWATQLEKPAATLRALSGQPVTTFAYPYGAWNAAALPHVSAAGYTTAYQLQEKPMDRAHPELTLRRALAVSTWSGAQVVAALGKRT